MKDCGLICPDCGGDIEYSDIAYDFDIVFEDNYYCEKCGEFKDGERVIRKEDK